MDYTITITPDNWDVFLQTNPFKFAFRKTLEGGLKKIQVGDRFVVYLAQKMCWCGVFMVTKESYRTNDIVYPTEPAFCIVIEVDTICLPTPDNYVPIKEPNLWNKLERFVGVNTHKSGWIYGAKLARSFNKISTSDTDKIIEFLSKQTLKGS